MCVCCWHRRHNEMGRRVVGDKTGVHALGGWADGAAALPGAWPCGLSKQAWGALLKEKRGQRSMWRPATAPGRWRL